MVHDRGVIIWASRRIAQALGYHSLVGRYLTELVAQEDHPTLARALAAPGTGLLRLRFRTAGGEFREIESRGWSLRWQGRVVRYVVVGVMGEVK